jgi:hypothetical protein
VSREISSSLRGSEAIAVISFCHCEEGYKPDAAIYSICEIAAVDPLLRNDIKYQLFCSNFFVLSCFENIDRNNAGLLRFDAGLEGEPNGMPTKGSKKVL